MSDNNNLFGSNLNDEKDKISLSFWNRGFSQSMGIGNGLSMELDEGEIEVDFDGNYKRDLYGNLKRKLS